MTKAWQKFLQKLELKYRENLEIILLKIMKKDFSDLDIKPVSWKKWFFRCRAWKIRIIYSYRNEIIIIEDIWFRWDIYKWF